MRLNRWIFGTLLMTAVAFPQTNPAPRRKVGVALAGGSSLGLAHVGVLEWLEANRIPIDYVAGTSMGGLVAGLHATGHSAEEIRHFIADIDWNSALSQTPPFRQLSFRRKEDQRDYPTVLELGFKGGLNLPSGMSAGHGVGLILSRFTAPYSNLKSFDELPTPFRCVATDLVEAKEVVFSQGPLFDALRATMSLPALFSPVQEGKKVLVDGGLVNNLPVDIVKSMGADVVIAVALNKPPDPKEYRSLLGIAGRSVSVMVTDNERRNMGLADIVLMPNLEGFSGTDYPRYEDLRKSGYASAVQKEFLLKTLAISETEWAKYQDARKQRRMPETIKPEFIRVEGDVAPKRLESLVASLSTNKGEILDRHTLEIEMTRLTGLGRFDSAEYRFVREEGKEGLVVRVQEKRHGPPFLKVGMLIDGSPDQGLRFGIGGRLVFLDTGGPASEWRSDFSIGSVNRATTEYYYRIGGGKWFLAPRAYYTQDQFPYYQGKNRILEFKNSVFGAGGDVGYAFGRFQEARFGYDIGQLRTRIQTGFAPADLRGRISGFRGRWVYEGQDNPIIPRRGIRFALQPRWVTDYPGVDKQFPVFEGTVSYARPIRGRYFMWWEAAGGTTSEDAELSTLFYTGGLLRISALARGQLLGNHYYNSGLYGLRSLSNEQLALFGRFYAALGWEMGNAWTMASSTPRPYNSGVLGIMGETPLGLVFFGGAIGEQGERKILFRLGRYF